MARPPRPCYKGEGTLVTSSFAIATFVNIAVTGKVIGRVGLSLPIPCSLFPVPLLSVEVLNGRDALRRVRSRVGCLLTIVFQPALLPSRQEAYDPPFPSIGKKPFQCLSSFLNLLHDT